MEALRFYMKNKTLAVVLKDANMQEIAKQQLKTNEYGSVAGEFVLPRNVLSGYFQLVCEDQAGRIQGGRVYNALLLK